MFPTFEKLSLRKNIFFNASTSLNCYYHHSDPSLATIISCLYNYIAPDLCLTLSRKIFFKCKSDLVTLYKQVFILPLIEILSSLSLPALRSYMIWLQSISPYSSHTTTLPSPHPYFSLFCSSECPSPFSYPGVFVLAASLPRKLS